MNLLGFLIGVAIGGLIYTFFSSEPTANKECKPHKWVQKGEEGSYYLVCSKCKKIPSTDLPDAKEEEI